MLYTLARRYDEYDGENYDGSSCRGAHQGLVQPRRVPGGGLALRAGDVEPREVRLCHPGDASTRSACTTGSTPSRSPTCRPPSAQQGAVFVSRLHPRRLGRAAAGEAAAAKARRRAGDRASTASLRRTAATPSRWSASTPQGFILQNSWGTGWGAGGFAVLTYLDWLANGMDAWVVSLGVPGVVAGRLARRRRRARSARAGADRSKWWDTGLAYQHSVVLRQRRPREPLPHRRRAAAKAAAAGLRAARPVVPRAAGGRRTKRLVIYAHGGLNSEEAAIKRASAMGRFFIGNGCYPMFLVWKTGLLESIGDILADALQAASRRRRGRPASGSPRRPTW